MNRIDPDIKGEIPSPQEQLSQTTVSVIMPVYNGAHFIDKSLPPLLSLLQQGKVIEVIVVDDASTDNTPEIAIKIGARVISPGEHHGSGGARNRGGQEATGDLLWFVDADVVVHDDAIKHLTQGFSEPDVVAVFGSYDDRPTQKNFFSLYKNLVHHHYHQHGCREATIFWSGCGAVRKESFIKVGGFNIKFSSLEDIELGYRLVAGGGRILLLADMLGTHLKEWRFIDMIYTEIFCNALPWSRLMLTQTRTVNDLRVGVAERFRAILAGLLFFFMGAVALGIFPWWSLLVMSTITVFANKKLFGLFFRQQGPLFALGGLLYRQFFYLYSSAAFVWCWFEVNAYKKLT